MDCSGYRDVMVADVHGALSPSETSAARGHLDVCADCRKARAIEAELGAVLRRPDRIVETPPQLRERIVVALAGVEAAAATARRRRLVGVVAVAVGLLAGLVLLGLLR